MTGWTISIGPFKFGPGMSKGGGIPYFWVQPKFNVGVEKDGFDFHAGLSDLRDGVEIGATAGYTQHFEAEGNSLVEFLESVKSTGCPEEADAEFDKTLTEIFSAVPHVYATVFKMVGFDISGSYVKGVFELNVTLGVSGKVAAGLWTDADGYRMVGAGGKIACLAELKYSVFIGRKDDDGEHINNMKVVIAGPNFTMKLIVDTPHNDHKEPEHKTWKHVEDEEYVTDDEEDED